MSMKPQDNEKICLVENGAPMGVYLRETHWFPAMLSWSLEAGGDPQPLRLIGEDFVAFRGENGEIGVFDEHCPHRRASLLLARAEDNALRCIFHGWKFRYDGTTVEAPSQHSNHDEFCKTVPLRHYPVREAGGIVWVWLGKSEPKPFPNFMFNQLTGPNVRASLQKLKFNWIQSIEGLVDTAHVSFLHRDWVARADTSGTSLSSAQYDASPKVVIEDQPYGFHYAGIRRVSESEQYVRITPYATPFYCFIPYGPGQCVISVPMDDRNTLMIAVQFDKDQPLKPSHYGPTDKPDDFPPYLDGGKEIRWGQDRDLMRRESFSGFTGHLNREDFAVAESQGAIADRSREFLSDSDGAVRRFRRLLLQTVNDHEAGKLKDTGEIDLSNLVGIARNISKSEDWQAALN